MNDNPLVSIIIPTYNRWKYIKKAIDSCLGQTYRNIEILVIDDCSSDNTNDIIEWINDSRIKYFKNINNSWAPFSRNRWIKLSKWDFINFLDDDDELLPKKIELQIEKFKNSCINNLWVVTCDIKYNRSDNNKLRLNRKSWFIYKDLLRSYCISWTQSMLIKSNVFDFYKFDLGFESNQEYDLMIQISSNYNFDFIDYVWAIQNESENQISFNFRKKIDWSRYLFWKYKKDYTSLWYKFYLIKLLWYNLNIFKYYVWLLFWKWAYSYFSKLLYLILNIWKK